ncbi:MAG: hypothetical protein AAFU79_08915 [Myxococcota bacterium]
MLGPPAPNLYERLAFTRHDALAWSPRLADQPLPWRREMVRLGRVLDEEGVAEICFVHGTFVGSDPFALFASLRRRSQRLDRRLARPLQRLWARATHTLTGEFGNFSPGYVRLFSGATALPCSRFSWSSENTHAGRLAAAAQLAHHLVKRLDEQEIPEPSKVVLVGHSHAGQVFALLLQMVEACDHGPELVRLAGELGEDPDWLAMHLERLRHHDLRIVTLGTPPRYGWPASARGRLLHIVNHRGEEPLAGRMDGVLTTRDGDYIQQWGIVGSDLPAASRERRQLNRELDGLLGNGHAPKEWRRALEHRKRVHDVGRTLLVDYGDGSAGRPNFVLTNFGHAIYTRRSTMRFWLSVAARRLFEAPRVRSH